MITLYNVISADGFIARKDGSEDFIPEGLWGEFLDLCKGYDTIVMGRKTYEAIQEYPRDHIEEFEKLDIKKVIVTKDNNFLVKPHYIISHSPEEALIIGKNTLLTSGPTLNTYFLEKGLIDKVILNVLPEKIGEGIRLFNIEPKLALVFEKEISVGRKWQEYKVE